MGDSQYDSSPGLSKVRVVEDEASVTRALEEAAEGVDTFFKAFIPCGEVVTTFGAPNTQITFSSSSDTVGFACISLSHILLPLN